MKVYINDEEDSLEAEGLKTIGDALRAFEAECEKQDGAVIGITIDDKKITADNFDAVSLLPLKSDTKFNFDVITRTFVLQSLIDCAPKIRALSQELKDIGVLLQSGKSATASKTIQKLADNMGEVYNLIKYSALFGDYATKWRVGDMTFHDFLDDFAPVLKDLLDAMGSSDSVTISDLSEYEISGRLEDLANTLEGVTNDL